MRKEKVVHSFIITCIVILALSVGMDFVLHNSGKVEQNTEVGVGDVSGKNKESENEDEFAQRPTGSELEIYENIEGCVWVYEYWSDFKDDYDLPYADEEIFAILREAYGEITFQGVFERGNLECYDEYKVHFLKLLDNEITFTNMETGDKVYLKDFEDLYLHGDMPYDKYKYEYYFFDVDEDGALELGIKNPLNHSIQYIFRYDEEKEECFLWHMTDSWCSLYGSRKVAWSWDGGKYIAFEQLNANGDTELETFGINSWYNEETCLHAVMLPDYREKEKKKEVTDLMKQQGIYVRSTGRWFFRITEKQYEELMNPFWEAYYLAAIEIEAITYSYEELFDDER